jgi:hypothetical protein
VGENGAFGVASARTGVKRDERFIKAEAARLLRIDAKTSDAELRKTC